MATITPTSDQRQWTNNNTFRVDDTVQNTVDGRIGVIINPTNLIPTVIAPGPPPVVALLPVPFPELPIATPQQPPSSIVNVEWSDGTFSLIDMKFLRRP